MSGGGVDGNAVVRRLLGNLQQDVGRIGLAFGAALVLWFFIGTKVEADRKYVVDVIPLKHDESTPGQGLLLRIPPEFVLEDVNPRRLTLRVTGKREEIDRLPPQLTGTWVVPDDFCRDAPLVRKNIDVTTTFNFAAIRSLSSVVFQDIVEIEVAVARREKARVVLSKELVELTGDGLPEDAAAVFTPSAVEVSGAQDVVQRLVGGGARLRLALKRGEVAELRRGPLSLSADTFEVVAPTGPVGRVAFEQPKVVELRISRTSPPRVVKLENVPIGWLNVKTAWREGVDRDDPVRIAPETMWIEVSVPSDFASSGVLEEELLKRLNMFVDMREMPFSVEAAPLPVHAEGLPPGATIKLEHERVDVEWRKSEPAADTAKPAASKPPNANQEDGNQ